MLEGKLLLSIEDVMQATSLRRSKVFELLADGSLESCHVGRRRLIPRTALDAFVARLRAEGEAEQGS